MKMRFRGGHSFLPLPLKIAKTVVPLTLSTARRRRKGDDDGKVTISYEKKLPLTDASYEVSVGLKK